MTHRNESFPKDGLEELDKFIGSNPKPRELKRALAVKMLAQGLKTETIQQALGVSAPFISKWKVQYAWNGIQALKVKYQGSKGYLSQRDRRFASVSGAQSRGNHSVVTKSNSGSFE